MAVPDININEINFNKRLNQIGHYTYESQMNALFVFQLTFIFLLIGIALYYLANVGIVSPLLVGFLGSVLVIILALIYYNRFVVMNKLRSSNNWTSIRFNDDGSKQSPTYPYIPAGTDVGTPGAGQTCTAPTPGICTPIIL